MSISFTTLGKFSGHYFFSNRFLSLSLSFPSGSPIMQISMCLMLPQKSPKLSLYLIYFSCFSDYVLSITLSFLSLIHSLASSNLLIHSSESFLFYFLNFKLF